MEAVVVSASQGAMASLLAKLAALLTEQYEQLKGARGEVMFLKAELDTMHAFLQKLSSAEEPHDAQLKLWAQEVRELSYDMEDCIDDFTLRLHADPKSKPHGFRGFMERTMNLLTKTKTRHRIAAEMRGLKKSVMEVSARRARYKLDEAISTPTAAVVPVDPRLRFLHEAAELVGVGGPREELVRLLLEERGEMQQLKVVSIVGFGGLGKTTLANEVYRHAGAQFECGAFVSVSQKPDVRKILRKMLDQVSRQKHGNVEASWDEDELILRLREFLQDKRYLVIIDDIWSIPVWRTIKCALLENNCGSRIITTTRNIEVAESCSSLRGSQLYKMKPLSTANARMLFFTRIFGAENRCPPHLEEVSDEILKKCGGLPLAVITIASLLASKPNAHEQWERVRSSIGFGLAEKYNVEEMNSILSLSYNDLPHHLKTCLLYLSTFPEDYKIRRDRLIRRWIAEGFVNTKGGQHLEEVGESYFNELINRSMIEPASIWIRPQTMASRYNGRTTACKLHDMILDLIILKSTEENFVTLFGEQKHNQVQEGKVRRLSLDYRNQEHDVLPSTVDISHVRSLTIFGNADRMPQLLEFRFLRVLDLQGSEKLENHHLKNIGRLFQLKYLGLADTNIRDLPEQIGKLKSLETLDVRRTYVQELPASIVRLQKLVRLLLSSLPLPDGIGNMQALEELSFINLNRCSLNSVQELGNLTKLQTLGVRSYFDDRHSDFRIYRENLVSSLNKLSRFNLRSLYIGGQRSSFLLDSWSPPPNLQKFEMDTSYYLPVIPVWIASLHSLTHLDIKIKQMGEEDLQVLGDLPALLVLIMCSDGGTKGRLAISGRGFQCLKEFYFECWNCGMGVVFAAGAFPKLELLSLEFNARETRSLYGGFDFGIQHLSQLKQVLVEISSLEEEDVEAAFRNEASSHPNRPMLLFKRWSYFGMRKDGERVGRGMGG